MPLKRVAQDTWSGIPCEQLSRDGTDCTDCGNTFLSQDVFAGDTPHAQTAFIGGGTVTRSRVGRLREVHIVPHSGTELPDELVDALAPPERRSLGKLVHDNADTGTGLIFKRLTDDVRSGQLKGAAVAGFHVSRLLIDANRDNPRHQVPPLPYVGTRDLYGWYQDSHRESLRHDLLLPWLHAVNELLLSLDTAVVYHHHTYDLRSMSPRPFDSAPGAERPPFQLSWRRASLAGETTEFLHVEDAREGGLAPLEVVHAVHDQISRFVEKQHNLTHPQTAIDQPLNLPLTGFIGTRDVDVQHPLQHVLYDIRKDMLGDTETIESWLHLAPWRIPDAAVE